MEEGLVSAVVGYFGEVHLDENAAYKEPEVPEISAPGDEVDPEGCYVEMRGIIAPFVHCCLYGRLL